MKKVSPVICGQLVLLILCSTALAESPSNTGFFSDQMPVSSGQITEGKACPVNYETELETCRCQTEPMTSCGCSDTYYCSPNLWMHPCNGLFGDVELLLLRWTDTDGDDSQSTAQACARYTLGYMDCQGRGFRARYFDLSIPDQDGRGDFITSRLDLEYAGRFTLGHNWHGDLSIGARWASLENPTPREYSNTWGPVFGMEIHSHIRDWLSIYGTARQSFQFGSEHHEKHNSVFGITELGAGLEVSKSYRCSRLFFRSGVEVQHYTSVRDDEEDYGLVGLALRFGLRR